MAAVPQPNWLSFRLPRMIMMFVYGAKGKIQSCTSCFGRARYIVFFLLWVLYNLSLAKCGGEVLSRIVATRFGLVLMPKVSGCRTTVELDSVRWMFGPTAFRAREAKSGVFFVRGRFFCPPLYLAWERRFWSGVSPFVVGGGAGRADCLTKCSYVCFSSLLEAGGVRFWTSRGN